MFPGAKINTFAARGAHTFSDAATMLGGIASVVVRHSSQTEKQFMNLQRRLRRFTSLMTPDLRLDVITYGEDHFWNKPSRVDLEPTLARVVDSYIAKAKAA